MNKQEIQKVFEAQNILNTNLVRNGMLPSDLTEKEYLEDVYNILNDENYKKELIEENELS